MDIIREEHKSSLTKSRDGIPINKKHLAIWLRRAPSDSKANSARPKAAHKTAIYRNRAQSGVGRLMTVPNVVTGSEFQRK
jgi:hypothetical protein